MSFGPGVTELTAGQTTAATLVPISKAGAKNQIQEGILLAELLKVANNVIQLPNGTWYLGTEVDGTTPVKIVGVNAANHISLDETGVCGFIRFGPSAARSSQSNILMHQGSTLCIESYDYVGDIPSITTDQNDNLIIGNAPYYSNLNVDVAHAANIVHQVQTGKKHQWVEQLAEVMRLSGSVLQVRAGTTDGPPLVSVGGSLFDDYADAASTHTDGTEDDLFTHTVLSNSLQNNGDKITWNVVVNLIGHAIATHRIQVYFAGTAIYDSTAINVTSNTTVEIVCTIIRESSTVVRCVSRALPASEGAPTYTRITGLTLTGSNILKVTGIAASTNAASGDITCTIGDCRYIPAAIVLPFPVSLIPFGYYTADAGTYQTVGGLIASANNDPVGSWLDQGTHENNLAQVTTTKRPLLKTNVINGLPALLFDGIDDFIILTKTLHQPACIYLVAKMLTGPGTNPLFYGDGNTSCYENSGGGMAMTAGTDVNGPNFNNSTFYTFRFLFNGASSKMALNGGADTTVNAGASNLNQVTMGGGNYHPANLYIAAALVLDYAPTTAQDTAIRSFFQTKYAHY